LIRLWWWSVNDPRRKEVKCNRGIAEGAETDAERSRVGIAHLPPSALLKRWAVPTLQPRLRGCICDEG
jgi:hypothetical protein